MSFDKQSGNNNLFSGGAKNPPENEKRKEKPKTDQSSNFDKYFREEFGGRDNPRLEKLISSPLVMPVFLATVAMTCVGFVFAREDIYTTIVGWNSLPFEKAYEGTGIFVGVGLFAFPFFAMILHAMTGQKRWYYVTALTVLTDTFLDMVFRMGDVSLLHGFGAWAVSIFMSFFVSFVLFTVFSELALGFGLPTTIFLFPYALKQFSSFAVGLIAVIRDVEEKIGEWSDHD